MLDSIREEKIKKLNNFIEAGIDPYPSGPFEKQDSQEVLRKSVDEKVKVAGRIMLFRDMGNITFLHIQDENGRIQIVLNKKEFSGDYKLWVKNLDVGDFIGVEGMRFDTQKGEKSVLVENITLLSKSILPMPDKHKAIQDEEQKLRKRYLDILFDPNIKEMIYRKDLFWNSIRNFLKKRNFIEVETPVLEVTAGGADAEPFVTHHNALDMDVFLRISMGELWQKRLMIAGMEKTFEIGRQFRNEGMDAEHLQDYTQVEFYWAYANYEKGMKLVEDLFKHVAQETFGTLKFKIRDFDIDLGKEWETYDYTEVIKEMTGVDIYRVNLETITEKIEKLGIKYDKEGFNINRAIDTLWKHCRKQIPGPGFLINEPLMLSPLAKKKKDRPELAERFHVIIAGSELGNGYSELNDPLDQAERFKEQQRLRDEGDEEAQMNDEDFVEAMEYGMPPVCGFGMSERVFSFLMNKTGRECQIFPLMKKKVSNNEASTKNRKTENNDSLKEEEDQELGISYDKARKLVDEFIKDEITKLHIIESEVIMKALARHLGEDEEKWGIIGLLHDIDWDMTKDDTKEHCVKCVEILKNAGGSDFLVEKIVSHNYGWEGNPDLKDKKRSTKLEHALVAAETLTGLIAASALVQPSKKLADVKLKSLKKKFKDKKFAANCDRELIMECEKIGIPIDEFLEIGLKSLQDISDELGM